MEISPSASEYNPNMIESQPQNFVDYLEGCAEKMGHESVKCAIEVRAEILRNKDASRDSCRMIVRAAKDCHMQWMKLFFQTYQLKRFSSKRILKSNEIWNKCSKEIGSVSPISD
ncbi:hypothetical protein Bca4012_010199 [Brassica carinata]